MTRVLLVCRTPIYPREVIVMHQAQDTRRSPGQGIESLAGEQELSLDSALILFK